MAFGEIEGFRWVLDHDTVRLVLDQRLCPDVSFVSYGEPVFEALLDEVRPAGRRQR